MTPSQKLALMAMSLDSVTEEPHFEKTSFRVKKKIFATYDAKTNLARVRLSVIDQDLFCSSDKKAMSPVPGKWGQSGWTYINLAMVNEDLLADAVTAAYREVAGKNTAKDL